MTTNTGNAPRCASARSGTIVGRVAADGAVRRFGLVRLRSADRGDGRTADRCRGRCEVPYRSTDPPQAKAKEEDDEPEKAIVSGKVVLLSAALKELGIKHYDEEVKGQVVLVTREGARSDRPRLCGTVPRMNDFAIGRSTCSCTAAREFPGCRRCRSTRSTRKGPATSPTTGATSARSPCTKSRNASAARGRFVCGSARRNFPGRRTNPPLNAPRATNRRPALPAAAGQLRIAVHEVAVRRTCLRFRNRDRRRTRAGLALSRVCTAGLAEISLVPVKSTSAAGRTCSTTPSRRAGLSQYAGWQVSGRQVLRDGLRADAGRRRPKRSSSTTSAGREQPPRRRRRAGDAELPDRGVSPTSPRSAASRRQAHPAWAPARAWRAPCRSWPAPGDGPAQAA